LRRRGESGRQAIVGTSPSDADGNIPTVPADRRRERVCGEPVRRVKPARPAEASEPGRAGAGDRDLDQAATLLA